MPVGSYEVNDERAVPTVNSGFFTIRYTTTIRPLFHSVKGKNNVYFYLNLDKN